MRDQTSVQRVECCGYLFDIPIKVLTKVCSSTLDFALLLQWRGGSELLVEAGDQRRSVPLPAAIRGKVSGAKFQDKSLIVTMKAR